MKEILEHGSGPDDGLLNEVKVVFLGDGGVGKTRTIARLMNDGGSSAGGGFEDRPTYGIAISDKEYEFDGRRITVHFWDVGGHELLHPIHRVFLTRRTLYVVMVSADGTQNDRARYWLNNIKSFANGSPVLLVLNKTDQNPNASVNERDLRLIYPDLRQVVNLSAVWFSQKAFNHALTEVLLEEIRRHGIIDMPEPASWRRLKEQLRTLRGNYISGSLFMELSHSIGVYQDQEELIQWLHDLGIILYCRGTPSPYDMVALRPEWVANAICTILFNRSEKTQNGIIYRHASYELLATQDKDPHRRALPDVTYSVREAGYILEVMHQFGLSCSIDDERLFIPSLCQWNILPIAGEYADAPDTLEFRMTYEYLPVALIHRLMMEMRQDLDLSNVWLTGGCFRRGSTGLSAVVKSDRDQLHIFVRSEDGLNPPNTYLSIIIDTIDRINRDMGLSSPFEEVVYKSEQGSEIFDYRDLLSALECGEETYRSRRLRRNIPIRDILNQTGISAEPEIRQLRKDIAAACMLIQENRLYWDSPEDHRNDLVWNILSHKGYLVSEQTFLGSGRNNRSGMPDLDIRRDPDVPWTLLEALRINDRSKSDWNRHLDKLLIDYNPIGLRHLFLLTYVDCSKERFPDILDSFTEHIRWYEPVSAKCVPGTFQFLPADAGNPYQRIMQCSYDVGGAVVTVYHYFVQIGNRDRTAPGKQPALPAEPPVPPPQPEEPEAADEDKPILYEYRVVILGDSEAGKSHILARLKNPELEHTAFSGSTADPKQKTAVFSGDTTDGIDIAAVPYSIKGKQVRVNYWDFGGQEILHSMQRLFRTRQALYVIVLNTRNDNQDAQADFWLRYVQTYAPGAPVFLVLNKIDQNPGAALNMSMLRRRFGDMLERCKVLRISARDCPREQFKTGFIQVLTDRIHELLTRECRFSARELRIRDRLDRSKEAQQLISFSTFRQFCEEEGVTEKKAQNALQDRFRQAGILVRFQTKFGMLLDPQWITKAVFTLLKKRDKLTRNGMLSRSDIDDLYLEDPSGNYQEEHIEFILQIMRENGLSFQYQPPGSEDGEPMEFIPMLCRREEPQIPEPEPKREPMELQLHYDYLPPSVIHQLMVDRHQELDMEKAWLSGAVLRNADGCTAVVRRDANVLTIFVWSNDPAYSIQYRDALKKHIDRIALSDLHNAIAREIRIGYQLNGTTEYFNYNRLQNAKACEVRYTVSVRSHHRIAVQDILDQTDRSETRDLETLLETTLSGCMELQADQTFWFRGKAMKELEKYLPKMDENARNRQLRRTLGSRFIVKDQPQIGESASGRSPGELDLAIFIKPGIHWSIIEALNITGINSDSEGRWNEHLHRMMEHYNKSGLRNLLLVSYLNCPEEALGSVHEHYFALLKKFTPEGLGCTQTLCNVHHMTECPDAIRITRADYKGGRGAVSVFHFLVHIPQIAETSEPQPVQTP